MIEDPGSGPLRALVREAAAPARHLLGPGPVAGAIDAVLTRLAEPALRIAVGGRIKAGKSTLINALAGQRVAATGAAECTLLVAWFRAGHQNRIAVHRVDGTTAYVRGRPGGGVPADPELLGTPREQISELTVEVVNDQLSRYTLVDTPGMDALSGLDEPAMAALARSDALLYVMPHPGDGDREALEALRRNATGAITATNVVGVLSRIDELGSGTGDPWPLARRLAGNYTARLNGLVASTVPVVGLVAQAVSVADGYTEDDHHLISRLAAGDPADLVDALYSADDFREWRSGPLGTGERARVLGLLGRHGIAVAVEIFRSGPIGTAAMRTRLRGLSGIDELAAVIRERFVGAADRLRATAALTALDDIARRAEDPAERAAMTGMRARLAEVWRSPSLRQARLTGALADLAADRLTLPDPDAAALVALATGAGEATCLGLPPDAPARTVAEAALAQVSRWRALESTAPRATQRHARAAREFCEAVYFASAGATA